MAVLHLRSAVPGRTRWQVSPLAEFESVARMLVEEVAKHPKVVAVVVNVITKRILVHHDPSESSHEVRIWLLEALLRCLQRLAEERASANTPTKVAGAGEAPLSERTTDSVLPRRERFAGLVVSTLLSRGENPGWLLSTLGAREGRLLARLLLRTRKHHSLIILSLGAGFLGKALEQAPALLLGLVTDSVTRGSGSLVAGFGIVPLGQQLAAVVGIGAVLWGATAGLAYCERRLGDRYAHVFAHELRVELYRHIQTLDQAFLHKRRTGGLMSLLQNDVDKIHDSLRHGLSPFADIAATFLSVGGAMFLVSRPLVTLPLLTMPVLVIGSVWLLKPIRRRFAAARAEASNFAAQLVGNLEGIETILAFSAEGQEAERIAAASQRYLEKENSAHALAALFVPFMLATVGAGFMMTVAAGGVEVAKGRLSAGSLQVAGHSCLNLLTAVARLGMGINHYQQGMASFERLIEVLDTEPSTRGGSRVLEPAGVSGAVAFEDVTFGYEEGAPLLRNARLRIPAGHTIGIVGPTGAGKSTIIRLLLRFHDVEAGKVTLDGIDIRDLELRSLRSVVGFVSRDAYIFPGTVRENIAFGRPDADLNEIREAARAAQAEEFIETLPRGYETLVGERGLNLSTGQRQRLALARALVTRPRVLALDEATASVDNETEERIMLTLKEQGRTTVVIAHRLNAVRGADCIYVVARGSIVEQGTHDGLVVQGGMYANLWRLQGGGESAAATAPSAAC